jgi:hypothetical protein
MPHREPTWIALVANVRNARDEAFAHCGTVGGLRFRQWRIYVPVEVSVDGPTCADFGCSLRPESFGQISDVLPNALLAFGSNAVFWSLFLSVLLDTLGLYLVFFFSSSSTYKCRFFLHFAMCAPRACSGRHALVKMVSSLTLTPTA